MIGAASFYGRAVYRSISATLTVAPRLARVWCIASTAGQNVDMPDATGLTVGTVVYLLNIGSNTYTARDDSANSLGTVAAGAGRRVILLDNSETAGAWSTETKSFGTNSALLQVLDVFMIGGTGTATVNTSYAVVGAAWTTGTVAPRNRVEGAGFCVGPLGAIVGNYPVDAASSVVDFIDGSGSWSAGYTNDVVAAGRTMAATMARVGYVFSGDATLAAGRFSRLSAAVISAVPIAKTRGTAQGIGPWAVLIAGEPVSSNNLAYQRVGDFYVTIPNYAQPTRRSIGGFALNGVTYVIGGRRDSPATRYDVVEAFDFLNQSWAAKTAVSLGVRYGGCGVQANGRGYYGGGLDNTGTTQAGVASYVSDTWRAEAALPAARSGFDNLGVSV